jgi:sugar lactone lactonase YvrE
MARVQAMLGSSRVPSECATPHEVTMAQEGTRGGPGRRALLALVVLLAPASARPQEDTAELRRLEAMRARAPRDSVVLFNLAALHAAAGRRAETLDLLEAVSRAPGGLDPGFYRGFFFLRGDPAFERILARIRAAHPPRVRGVVAFTLGERDLQPEGIAFDPSSRATFAGSFKGKIVRIAPEGAVTDFAVVSTPESPRVVVGLRVDPARGHLWAVVDDPRAFVDPAVGGSGLHQYELASGRLLARYAGAPAGAFNDVAVTPAGEAFATQTTDGSVWRAVPGRPDMTEFLPAGTVPEANGITATPDGRQLYVAGWHDIHRVDLPSGAVNRLVAPRGVPVGSFDGLLWHRGSLVGIQNGIHPGRVVRLRLDGRARRIRSAAILERYHPRFNGVTTAALDGDDLLYFANTQSRAFGPDGKPKPGVTLEDIVILRQRLR